MARSRASNAEHCRAYARSVPRSVNSAGSASRSKSWGGARLGHRRLAPKAPGAEIVAVIRGVNSTRRVCEAGFGQHSQDIADLLVEKRYEAEIAGQRPLQVGRATEVCIVIRSPCVHADIGMVRPLNLVVEVRAR